MYRKPKILRFQWCYQYKHFDPNNIKIDEKSYKNTLIYYIGYVTIKGLKFVKINIVNVLYLILNKLNKYFEEINKSTLLR